MKSENVFPSIASLIIPGVGQFVQRRVGMGLLHLILAFALWWLVLGWLVHLWSAADAYLVDPAEEREDFSREQDT